LRFAVGKFDWGDVDGEGEEEEEEEGRGVQGTGKVDGSDEEEGAYVPSSPEGMSKLFERYVLFVASTNICGSRMSVSGVKVPRRGETQRTLALIIGV
jgi:hypothetical protein